MEENLNKLERKALKAALVGEAPWLKELRQQIPKLQVVSREYTGVGFYTDFICKDCQTVIDLPRSGTPETVPVAWAAHPDIFQGAKGTISFNVFLKNGVIACLEGASVSSWPEDERLIIFECV